MKIWQRNAVVAVVVLFVAVSVYLSYTYNREAAENGEVPVYVPQSTASTLPSDNGSPSTGTVTLSEDRQAYFAEARLTRQRARDSALEVLNEAVGQAASTQEAKDDTLASITKIAGYAMSEATIEGLIKAKGYEDCVVYISEDKISVVVAAPENGLTAADVTKIKDICMRETDYTIGAISILEA